MFSVFGVFSVLCVAVVACVGLDRELSVFPCLGGFGVFFFAVRTLSHNYPVLYLCFSTLKNVLLFFWGLSMAFWIRNQYVSRSFSSFS